MNYRSSPFPLKNDSENPSNDTKSTDNYTSSLRNIRSILKKSCKIEENRLMDINKTFEINHFPSNFKENLCIESKNNLSTREAASFDIPKEKDNNIPQELPNENEDNEKSKFNHSDCFEEEAPLDALTITKIEKEENISLNTLNSLGNNSIFSSIHNNTSYNNKEISTKKEENNNNSCPNINSYDSITNRLLDKIKKAKELEEELKEKDKIIKMLKEKIEIMKKEIMSKDKENLEKITNDKEKEINLINNTMKENKEDMEQKKKIMISLLENYRGKIANLINSNEISLEKITELQYKIKVLTENENKYQNEKNNFEKRIFFLEQQNKNLNENFENETKLKNKLEKENKNYKNIIIELQKYLFMISEKIKSLEKRKDNTQNSLIDKLKLFFDYDVRNNYNIIQKDNL